MGDVTIGVKGTGVTKIDGADARLAFLGGSAIAITPTSASINTPVAGGARVIILGKDAADRLGIGTTDPQATLHVQ
ncbi:MAG: hypothetical protein H6766_01200 [Candidatus Peribacteria bacterium]|nr:MAG: hypothetical protein H6766_01200 [Candidatus Peribacteria bacterium]